MDGNRGVIKTMRLIRDADGGVLAFVALFLPIAVLCVGMVVDLGTVFFVRKTVQAACDLGALAGVQELDWDALAAGTIAIRVEDGELMSQEVARENLVSAEALIRETRFFAVVENPPARAEPRVTVTAAYVVNLHFLRFIPGLESGFAGQVLAEASVVKRTDW